MTSLSITFAEMIVEDRLVVHMTDISLCKSIHYKLLLWLAMKHSPERQEPATQIIQQFIDGSFAADPEGCCHPCVP